MWCRREGHDVTLLCYTGSGDLLRAPPDNTDVVFIGAFTESAQTAYALSNYFRSRGALTVLGGPHARCYPQDTARHFDYVLGFVDREVVRDVLQDQAPIAPWGCTSPSGNSRARCRASSSAGSSSSRSSRRPP